MHKPIERNTVLNLSIFNILMGKSYHNAKMGTSRGSAQSSVKFLTKQLGSRSGFNEFGSETLGKPLYFYINIPMICGQE